MRRKVLLVVSLFTLGAALGSLLTFPSLAQSLKPNILSLVSTASGVSPKLVASGLDANLDVNVIPKGTGCLAVNGVCVTAGSGVTGTGTTRTFALWTDGPAGVIGSSLLEQSLTGSIGSPVPTTLRSFNMDLSGFAPAITENDTVQFGTSTFNVFTFNLAMGTTNTLNDGEAFLIGISNTAELTTVRSFAMGFANHIQGTEGYAIGDTITISPATTFSHGFGHVLYDGGFDHVTMLGDNMVAAQANAVIIGFAADGDPAINGQIILTSGSVAVPGIRAIGAATGKKVVCIDDTTKILFTSNTSTDCSN